MNGKKVRFTPHARRTRPWPWPATRRSWSCHSWVWVSCPCCRDSRSFCVITRIRLPSACAAQVPARRRMDGVAEGAFAPLAAAAPTARAFAAAAFCRCFPRLRQHICLRMRHPRRAGYPARSMLFSVPIFTSGSIRSESPPDPPRLGLCGSGSAAAPFGWVLGRLAPPVWLSVVRLGCGAHRRQKRTIVANSPRTRRWRLRRR